MRSHLVPALVLVGALLAVVVAVPAQETTPPSLRAVGDRGPDSAWPPVAGPSVNRGLPPLTEGGRIAFDVLFRAERFTDAAIGEGGITPVEVESMRLLHREPHATAAFLALCQRGTPAGRLWGLCGLWYWDVARFHRQVAALLRDHGETKVKTQRGCCIGEETVREIVRVEGTGTVRLESRKSTCRAWIEEHAPESGARYDIVGGGWPCVFRSGGGW